LWNLRGLSFRRSLKRLLPNLNSIASLPGEKNEGRNQYGHDKHPVLDFESQKRKMPDKKLHRYRPLFMQNKGFRGKNILFFYLGKTRPHRPAAPAATSSTIGWRRLALPQRIKGRAWPQPCEGCLKLRSRAKRRVEQEQLVELRRIVADTIGSCNEDLPTLFRKRPSFGDSDDNA
jgi:hypothetical protein